MRVHIHTFFKETVFSLQNTFRKERDLDESFLHCLPAKTVILR